MPIQYEVTHGLSASDSDTIACNATSLLALGDALGAGQLAEETTSSLGVLVFEKANEILEASRRISSLLHAGPLVIHSNEQAQRIVGFISTLRTLDELGVINPLFSTDGLEELSDYLTREARRLGLKPKGGVFDGKRRAEHAIQDAQEKFQAIVDQAVEAVKSSDSPKKSVQAILELFGIRWQNCIDPSAYTVEGGEA